MLLDPVIPGFAESTVFVAGDRVTTDLLAMPFSMGRNLLCIFSKKHVVRGHRSPAECRAALRCLSQVIGMRQNNPPEQKARKQRHNRMAMKTMQNMFAYADSFDQQLAWDTSQVTNMWGTFTNAEAFNAQLEGSPLQGREYRVGARGATLGRRASNSIAFTHALGGDTVGIDSSVSAEHARLVHVDELAELGVVDGAAGDGAPAPTARARARAPSALQPRDRAHTRRAPADRVGHPLDAVREVLGEVNLLEHAVLVLDRTSSAHRYGE